MPRLSERSLCASSPEQSPALHPEVAEAHQCSGRPQVGRPRHILGRTPAGLPEGTHIGSNSFLTPLQLVTDNDESLALIPVPRQQWANWSSRVGARGAILAENMNLTSNCHGEPTAKDGLHSLLGEGHDLLQSFLWHFALIVRCHQLPERSFSFRSRQVPLCARCLGIYLGALAIPLYACDLRIAAALIALMIIDGGTQALGLRVSKNWIRFASGIGFSLGCGGLLERGIQHLCSM
jgi:uncharacterized membrane protein